MQIVAGTARNKRGAVSYINRAAMVHIVVYFQRGTIMPRSYNGYV